MALLFEQLVARHVAFLGEVARTAQLAVQQALLQALVALGLAQPFELGAQPLDVRPQCGEFVGQRGLAAVQQLPLQLQALAEGRQRGLLGQPRGHLQGPPAVVFGLQARLVEPRVGVPVEQRIDVGPGLGRFHADQRLARLHMLAVAH